MNRPPILWILVIGSVATMALAEDDAEKERKKLQTLRQAVIEANSASDAGKAFRDYFHQGGLSQLAEPNTSIALQAAWHRRVVSNPLGPPKSRPNPAVYLKYNDAQRFFGFLEGRTGLEIPRWWQHGEQFPDLRRFGFYDRKENDPDGFVKLPEALNIPPRWKFAVEKFVEAEVAGDDLRLIERKDRSVLLKQSLLKSLSDKYQLGILHCEVRFLDNSVYLTFFDPFGQSHPVVRIDGKTNQVDWIAEVWAFGMIPDNYINVGSARVESLFVTTSDQREKMVVWGRGEFGNFVEQFDAATGKADFRFSTNYWHQWDED